MFNYPELVLLSIILCVSALIFGISLRYKKVAFAKYSFYFGLVALFEFLSISSLYFRNELLTLLSFIIFILLLAFGSSEKTLEKLHISPRFYFSIVVSAFFTYSVFKSVFFPDFFINKLDISFGSIYSFFILGFIFFVYPIMIALVFFERFYYKGKFTNMFSFINFILTPLMVIIFGVILDINGIMTDLKFEGLSSPKVINGLKLDVGNGYYRYRYKNKLNEYLEIDAESGKTIQWHNLPAKKLSRAYITGRNRSGNSNGVIDFIYDELKVYIENDQLIHNRLCDKIEPLNFRFLSDNYNDWSEQNTEFVSCKLVADSPLNQMRILNNLGDEITLTYKPLQNYTYHPKKLYQDFSLFPYIKWHWQVNKSINLFPNVKSKITDLYLDDRRNLMALLIKNEIENGNIEKVILDNQCTLSRLEFRKMLVLNVGSNPVIASFPELSNEQKCTPQQLELYIDRKMIFDN